ncbi:bifunctional 4-hydroxy-2-oxoglutarate aldolase/2-dehydro-3-deoxy-phosphogluconate aldolase [Streptomyces sp. S1A1-8]|uniref:bifunctional 4-hydroxy-2-oxoglutarate aldolase/2-dehydro-3-deoxy-phosphogluconate aldolase n=1 Tax=Streptomyces TaxID=1883 RepID=UPI001164D17B|nr:MULTISPECIES: bifunctional 4-hydroxy-2-oxoglutarate aldolase/2-dehydro-3-deoxy-phosphogluconate aldolase [unclassified Streptomyces]QDN95453.1 bifunctional 4-hydroxy-2-oxoglutarate aldolase/2-dehydro-3-deoxy-phosphogluconate aldolase [Streptomyces sp. RLB1-9]QDO05744.1 bifunctional 4-hydroxy-2-oxoglutarate aldolase/2-dehydro-3-deoxy-phosphogluconate aldolase [Streptomyces sp. S1D4-23]QDO17175.1 bifunctional 4-hydroxy-2-oxoglutarate aldolase/2-dehydro-3-deoxy-phosphogluconate aldolase [Strepto
MNLLAALRAHRLLAIVRGSDPDAALTTVLTLAEEGVTLIEVSLSGRDALDVIARARTALGPDATLGAGTVLSSDDARAAQKAGAAFLVTPGVSDGIATGRELELPVLAGVMTPTDILQAQRLGADALKLFPAGSAGGPGYLRDLRGPFPDLPFVPVGGVDAPAAADYLREGAIAVGVGSPLIGDAAEGGDLTALRERARAFLHVVRADARP